MTAQPLMSSPIATGLIGYGLAGRAFHAPLIRAIPALSLVAIATSRADEVAALDPAIRAVADPLALIADPSVDLIVIASPTGTHADLARAALLAGKHVVVDKPFTLTLAEARALADLAQQVDRHLLVFHNRRWDSCFLSVRDAIERGEIGRVTRFASHFDRFRPEVRDRWRESGGPGSGVLYDLAPHLIDQALLLFGQPEAVSADIAILREGGSADDDAQITLRYPHMRVSLSASMNAPGGDAGGAPRFAVHGTRGSVVKRLLDQQETQLVAGMRPGDAGWGHDADPLTLYDATGAATTRPALTGHQDSYYALLADLLTGTGAGPITLPECVAVQEVIEAARISAQEGRVVSLPLP
jgi:predicted dehydrogenase